MKEGRLKNLLGNMALFTIGNFVTKLLVMLLVPFYTSILTTGEYGIADGLQATLLFLVPLLTVNVGEAALRFGIEKKKEARGIFIVLVRRVLAASIFVGIACLLIWQLLLYKGGSFERNAVFALFFAGLFFTDSMYESLVLFCQGCEEVRVMILGSISCTALVIAANIYFLLIIKIGLYGYLFAQMISYTGAGLIMVLLMQRKGIFCHRNSREEIGELSGEMHAYGRGMLLYSTSSWVNNALDRYFVLYMCGAAVNGLYAVAYKVPAILMVFQRIFAQAWQISANKSYEDEDSRKFFEKAYQGYEFLMILVCSGLMMCCQLIARLLFAKDFYYAWTLVPPLLFSVVFGAMTGFCGSICLAYKDGRSMGRATGIGALVNIILNFVGIRLYGAAGAAFATMISYFVMFVFANAAACRHSGMRPDRKREALLCLLLLVQVLAEAWQLEFYLIYEIVGFIIVLLIVGGYFYSEKKRQGSN